MKTPKTIQTKRVRPKASYRILHAATRFGKKRKQRASTAAAHDEFNEVPGVGIARALLVILLLHVAAIAGIYLHNRWSEGADIEAKVPALVKNTPPTRLAELKPHTVTSGDDYEKIARRYGVDCEMLMKVNEGKVLEPGWIINVPNRRTEEVQPVERGLAYVEQQPRPQTAYPQQPAYRQQSYGHQARPLIQSESETYPGKRPGELAPVEGLEPEPTRSAILIKPRRPSVQSPPPRREIIRRPAPQPRPQVVATGRSHIVRSGETLWRIATNHGVSVDALKRANPHVNVNALKIGASLTIPNQR